jgi:hypothetical protein
LLIRGRSPARAPGTGDRTAAAPLAVREGRRVRQGHHAEQTIAHQRAPILELDEGKLLAAEVPFGVPRPDRQWLSLALDGSAKNGATPATTISV